MTTQTDHTGVSATETRSSETPEKTGSSPGAPPRQGAPTRDSGQTPPAESPRRQIPSQVRPLLLLALAAFLVYAGYGGINFWRFSQTHTSTDDAYLTSDLVQVTPQIGGKIQSVLVRQNQHVTEGQLLFQLDDSTYKADVAAAQANLQVARAGAYGASVNVGLTSATGSAQVEQAQGTLEQAQSGIGAAQAGVDQAGSNVGAAQAEAVRAQAAIANSEAGVRSAQSAVNTAKAGLQAALAARTRAVDAVRGTQAQVATAQAGVRAAEANVASAQAVAERAMHDQQRVAELYREDATSAQQLDAATTTATASRAQLDSARQALAQAHELVNQRDSELASARDAIQVADAAVAQARSQVATSEEGVTAAAAAVRQSRAQWLASQQNIAAAQAQYRSTVQNVSSARAKLTQARGVLTQAQTTPRQVAVQRANAQTANARIKQAEAALQNALIALQCTRIVAPVSGRISANTAEIGQQVAVGQSVMVIIPDDDLWVTANFKETQLQDMKVNQPVEIEIDTFPGRKFEGYVESLSAGTGATFALLPPDNATGNFTKVVQRVPVRIFFKPNQPDLDRLRAGLSVIVTVKTR